MTTIITRLYADPATAQAAARDLEGRGHSDSYISIITRDGAGTAAERMRALRVPGEAAALYDPRIGQGAALLVVAAPFNPVGTARHAIRTLDRHPALDVGLRSEDTYIREQPTIETRGQILPGTVFYMTNPHRPTSHRHIFGQDPIIRSGPRRSAIAGGAYISTKFWPMRLLSAPRKRNSAIAGGMLMSSLIDMPTLLRSWD
jgi:hypothetical protein